MRASDHGGRSWRVAGLVLALGFTLVGCTTSADTLVETEGLPSTLQDLEAHGWNLTETGSSVTLPAGSQATIAFAEESVSGTAPCNAYRARFSLDGESLDISSIAQTSRSCAPRVMQAEREYFAVLERVTDLDLNEDANRLALTGPRGARLAFRAYAPVELLRGTWSVVNFATGDAIEGLAAGTDPTIVFEGDDDITGPVTLDAGCNPARGTWTLDGDRLAIDPLRQTMMACDEPAEIQRQDDALVRALESAHRIEITPTQLTVLDDEGRIAIIAVDPANS